MPRTTTSPRLVLFRNAAVVMSKRMLYAGTLRFIRKTLATSLERCGAMLR